jgi:RNA recognition motif-containing protein
MGTTIPSSPLEPRELLTGQVQNKENTMNIYVGNLSSEATDETIKQAFESFGEVTSARVIKDKYTGQSRGFGFVEMSVLSQAQTAINSLNGKELLGKPISVNEARPRADQGRTGRQGGGRMDYSGGRNRY